MIYLYKYGYKNSCGSPINYIFFSVILQHLFRGIEVIMEKYRVGIIGATGMVGQRFITLLAEHPWFEIAVLAASGRSAGKAYSEAVGDRWAMTSPLPAGVAEMTVLDAEADAQKIANSVDFVFCAVNLDKQATKALEEKYALLECPVISNNSANRWTPDVPMLIPELNSDHAEIISVQRKRLGTRRGFIAVKSNCSIQSYVPALHALRCFGVKSVAVTTYQAISGAGKTFKSFPDIIDNVIPYIAGEDEKSEKEPLKVWGRIEDGKIVAADSPSITAQCLRVPVSDGHMAAVFVSFDKKPTSSEILEKWDSFVPDTAGLALPSSPEKFLRYFEEDALPQTRLQRDIDKGMAISLGRLREDTVFDYKFVGLSHNTLRGAAGGAVLAAELLCAKGYITKN